MFKDCVTFSFFAAFMIIIMPLVRYYDFFIFPIGMDSFLVICIFFFLLINGYNTPFMGCLEKKKSVIFLLLFFAYSLFITIVNVGFKDIVTESLNALIIYSISVFLSALLLSTNFNNYKIFGIYNFTVWLVIIVYIIQWLFIFIGIKVSFQIPFFHFSNGWNMLSTSCFGMEFVPPTSLFSEKSHMSQFLVPYICFCLYSNDFIKKRNFLYALIVSVTIISTVSGNGVTLVGLSWLFYFTQTSKINLGKKIIVISVGFILLFAVYHFLYRIPVFSSMFDTLFVNKTGYSEWTKADYRIYRGLNFFSNMPFIDQIVGIGFRTISSYSILFGVRSIYDSDALYSYLSGISQVIIYFGIIGIVLFAGHLFYLQKNGNTLVKGLIIVYLAMSFSSETFFDVFYLLFLLLIAISLKNNIPHTCVETKFFFTQFEEDSKN